MHEEVSGLEVLRQFILRLESLKMYLRQSVLLLHRQVFLRGLPTHDVNTDMPVHILRRLHQDIKSLAWDKLSHGKYHLLLFDAKPFTDSLFLL